MYAKSPKIVQSANSYSGVNFISRIWGGVQVEYLRVIAQLFFCGKFLSTELMYTTSTQWHKNSQC